MAALPAASVAQRSNDWSNPFAKAMLDCFRLHWVDTKEYTLAMLDAMPADSFDFKAHPSQRGFGDQLAHLGWANVAYFRAFGPSLGVEDKLPKTYADVRKEYPVDNKEAVRKFVAATFDFSLSALDHMTQKDLMRADITPFPKSPTHSHSSRP